MDQRPRAETIRLMAAAAYLPPVALFLLLWPSSRELRLVRFHAFQAIGLLVAWGALFMLGGLLSSLLGGLPGLGMLVNVLVGLFFMAVLLGGTLVGFHGAWMAIEGRTTRVPVLSEWALEHAEGARRLRRGESPRRAP